MKRYVLFSILFFSALTVLGQRFEPAQQYKIDTLQITESGREGKKQQSVNSHLLKDGYNYIAVDTDRLLYIEVEKKQIKSFVLTKKDGTMLEKIAITNSGPFRFSCGWLGCICSGTADCNDLNSTGLCGATICVDNFRGSGQPLCICLRT